MGTVHVKTVSSNSIAETDTLLFVGFVIYGFFSQYLLLTLLAGGVFIYLLKSLWRVNVPPVLLFFLLFHWMQVFASILYADFFGDTLDEVYSSSGTELLFIMTFVQISIMSAVMSKVFNNLKIRQVTRQILSNAAKEINIKNVILGYTVCVIALPIIQSFARFSASVYQLAGTFTILKTMFIALLFFIVILTRTKNKNLIIGILVIDFLLSFVSYFSDFKEFLFLGMIVALTISPKFKPSSLFKLIPFVLILFIFLSFWSYVKSDYRAYINGGTSDQVVNVSSTQALAYISKRATEFNFNGFLEGGKILLSRMQYMERYSEVYARVPSVIPHTGGSELKDAVMFILVPRALNPNKGIKDASDKTTYYTGKEFADASAGTSISMGYFCDLFIDFGLFLMIIPLALIALMVSYVSKYILEKKGYNVILIYALLIGVFLSFGTFESDMIFFLGTIRNDVIFLLIGFYFVFPRIQRFILVKK